MSEESATADLIGLVRQAIDASQRDWVIASEDGLVVCVFAGNDIDGARAAAEPVAQERG
jgi:hypothetical protein